MCRNTSKCCPRVTGEWERVEPPGLALEGSESFASCEFTVWPLVQKKIPREQRILGPRCYIPMKQPERPYIFEERIESRVAEDCPSETSRHESLIPLRSGNAHHFNPEADRPNHILADSQTNHRLFRISKHGRVTNDGTVGLRQPCVAARKAFVS